MSYARIKELKAGVARLTREINARHNPTVGDLNAEALENWIEWRNSGRTKLVEEVKRLRPRVGQGATYSLASDCYAGTIVHVFGGPHRPRRVLWQRDKAVLMNGPCSGTPDALKVHPGGFCANVVGGQRWEYEPDPDGEKIMFTLRNNGTWKKVGTRTTEPGFVLYVGNRHEHHDYNL